MIPTDRLKPVTSLLCYQQSSKQIYLRNNPVIHHTRVSLIPPVMEAVLIGWSIYYRPQRSCGRIMFLHLSVILFTRGSQTPPPGQTPPGKTPPRQTPPPGRHPPGQTPPQADTSPRQTPPGQTPPGDDHCSGRYTSYWNAFLFVCGSPRLQLS